MFLTLKRNEAQPISAYWLKMIFFAATPSLLLAAIAAALIERGPSAYLGGDASIEVAWQLLGVGLIVPFVETFLLVFPTVLASDAIKRESLAALIGALPLVLLHALEGWAKPIVILFPFYVQAYAYIELRKTGYSPRKSFLFAFSMHAFINLSGALSIYAFS